MPARHRRYSACFSLGPCLQGAAPSASQSTAPMSLVLGLLVLALLPGSLRLGVFWGFSFVNFAPLPGQAASSCSRPFPFAGALSWVLPAHPLSKGLSCEVPRCFQEGCSRRRHGLQLLVFWGLLCAVGFAESPAQQSPGRCAVLCAQAL